jgi:hypothetical protein
MSKKSRLKILPKTGVPTKAEIPTKTGMSAEAVTIVRTVMPAEAGNEAETDSVEIKTIESITLQAI